MLRCPGLPLIASSAALSLISPEAGGATIFVAALHSRVAARPTRFTGFTVNTAWRCASPERTTHD
jgi:hypothetical protein